MSKITNDALTRSGTGCFIAVAYGNSGCQMLNDGLKSKLKYAILMCFQIVDLH